MRRYNSEALDRDELLLAFARGEPVRLALRMRQCLLCRSGPVNDAGLCEGCFANLTDEENRAALPWIEGRRK